MALLSFNVDDDIGKVVPYLKENGYTFPVMPAREAVDSVVRTLAIPQNWLVDSKRKLQWERIGYGRNAEWEEMVASKLAEMAGAERK